MRPTKEMLHSVPFQYAANVRSGKILVGKRIRQAVERFYTWIETAEASGYTLNHREGMFAVDFFPDFLNHTKGKMAGKPFILAPFQQFTIYNIFGWKNPDGTRRIRTVYDKRAKKNGKTAEMAGLALYMMSLDGEMEAEVYVGATKEEQAKLCFSQAASFIESPVANPLLRRLGFEKHQRIIHFHRSGGKMMPLGGDSKTQDGINAQFSIIDEYHAHRDDTVKENLESSSVSRLQPLTYHITTAGAATMSVCKNYEDSVIEVLEGRKVDNALWIMIHDLDEGDDWQDESVWYKANPLLGNGLSIDGIRVEYTKAINQPSKIPNFKTKHLNMWVDALEVWIPNEIWLQNDINKNPTALCNNLKEIPLSIFTELGCYGGLDLSSTTDITAFLLLSEADKEGFHYVKPFLFCPEDNIDKRSRNDGVPYRYWVDNGYMIATPGNRVDHDFILDFIASRYSFLNIKRVEVDPWNARGLTPRMEEAGVKVSELQQTMPVLNFPTKMLEKLIYEGKIKHDNNPVMAWMLSGCVVIEDSKGNIMISKGASHKHGKRIDGIAALINALAGVLSPDEETNESIYNNPDEEFYC
jgi:phage terminase large subunit-like protein